MIFIIHRSLYDTPHHTLVAVNIHYTLVAIRYSSYTRTAVCAFSSVNQIQANNNASYLFKKSRSQRTKATIQQQVCIECKVTFPHLYSFLPHSAHLSPYRYPENLSVCTDGPDLPATPPL
ncbi:hypothetical protein EDD17DRAFT_468517 [Pisolithus thermaeus]|nr:hypothetical protein EDD17DRAFT_650368 [Pisolithus thermaeus]KAI6169214.1 hypothetical protein EDD17DRAFT_468517 [Pisolithus thermaeus]